MTDEDIAALKAAKPGKELDELIDMWINKHNPDDGYGCEDCEFEIDPKPKKARK